MSLALIVARKEVVDHLRDRRALLNSTLLAVMGPAVVFLVSLSSRAGGENGPTVILGMLSVFALVSAFAGAIDIAMDATAGERERKSLLPLLLNPVPPAALIVGKWIAVTAFALAAVSLNVLGLVTVLTWRAPALLASHGQQVAVWIVCGLLPLALLGGAISVLVAVRCRTTKEAHSALTIMVFVPMIVGMFLVFFPAWVGQVWFLVPIVGQQALIGLRDQPVPLVGGVVLALATMAAAAATLIGAVGVLNRHDVLSV